MDEMVVENDTARGAQARGGGCQKSYEEAVEKSKSDLLEALEVIFP